MLLINKGYKYLIEPHLKYKPIVKLDDIDIKRVREFSEIIVKAKQQEAQYEIDGLSIQKRFFGGICSEVAIEKYLGIQFVDYTIGGSRNYNVPDMEKAGIRGGVKSTEQGKFPIVYTKNYYPQAMVVKPPNHRFKIAGVGKPKVLDRYQSDLFVLDKNILKKQTKSAFFGFGSLETL